MSEAAKASGNASIKKKTAARIAAVQSLYTLAINGQEFSPAQHVVFLKKQLAHNVEEQKAMGVPAEPNYALVQRLLEGIDRWKNDIDVRLDTILQDDWKRDRTSPLLIAILQSAIFEMFYDKNTKPTIIIDEYTRLTRSFFADAEVSFVHAALQKLAQKYG